MAICEQLEIKNDYGKCEAELLIEELGDGLSFSQFIIYVDQLGSLVRRRGNYIQLTPPPLAAWFLRDFYVNVPPHKLVDFFNKITSLERVKHAMAQRVRYLGNDGKEIVKILTTPDRPFSSSDVLLTETGSRLFSAFTEVNPSACLTALKKILTQLPKHRLINYHFNNFFLIEAIKKLCFYREIFAEAARLLLYFVGDSDARWTTRPLEEFCQLFHILLPGTTTPLWSALPRLMK